MITTLQRYFGMRFLVTLLAVLFGVFALIILLDYVEQMRRMADVPNVSALTVANISLFRVPQIAERILPFCVLIGAMSCFLGLSRRLELVVSRAAGMSAWQFTAPAIVVALGIGIIATTVYNPIAAVLQEKAKRMEAEVSGNNTEGLQATVNGFSVSQRSYNCQSIINAAGSREQGVVLSKDNSFLLDQSNRCIERVVAKPGRADRFGPNHAAAPCLAAYSHASAGVRECQVADIAGTAFGRRNVRQRREQMGVVCFIRGIRGGKAGRINAGCTRQGVYAQPAILAEHPSAEMPGLHRRLEGRIRRERIAGFFDGQRRRNIGQELQLPGGRRQ
ncbi:MAG: LptF/LptG family permease [Hyphomicrobiales bacterium]